MSLDLFSTGPGAMGDRKAAGNPRIQMEPCGKKSTDLRRAALARLSLNIQLQLH